MSRVGISLGAVGVVAAVFAALLASDLRSWADGIRNGDAQYAESPASATWSTPTVLPSHLARGILDISDQIAFRQAAQRFVPVHLLGNGFDNGYSESRARADLELVLPGLSPGRAPVPPPTPDDMPGSL